MGRKKTKFVFSLILVFGFSFCWACAFAASVPAPDEGGQGFDVVTLQQAKELHEEGATFIACHSHTTDFMKGHPPGTQHITCLVPKDHKRTDMPLSDVNFDTDQLPSDNDTVLITYCASNT